MYFKVYIYSVISTSRIGTQLSLTRLSKPHTNDKELSQSCPCHPHKQPPEPHELTTQPLSHRTRRGGAIAVDVNANVLYPRSDEEDLQDETSEEDCERDDSFDESCGVEVD